jgi:uncharacterized protein involved in tellurium resistance
VAQTIDKAFDSSMQRPEMCLLHDERDGQAKQKVKSLIHHYQLFIISHSLFLNNVAHFEPHVTRIIIFCFLNFSCYDSFPGVPGVITIRDNAIAESGQLPSEGLEGTPATKKRKL